MGSVQTTTETKRRKESSFLVALLLLIVKRLRCHTFFVDALGFHFPALVCLQKMGPTSPMEKGECSCCHLSRFPPGNGVGNVSGWTWDTCLAQFFC